MLARARADIHAGHLVRNARALAQVSGTPLIAPVKADAYGHGVNLVARALEDEPSVWGFAVAMPREAAALAPLTRKPVLLMTPAAPEEVGPLADLGVRLSVSSAEEVAALPAHARVHLKVDTGMNRLGAKPPEALRLGAALEARGLLEGVYTHLACADDPDLRMSEAQIHAFAAVRAAFPAALAHAQNGAGVLALGRVPGLDLARPGLALYGYPPEHLRARAELRPAMRVTARVGFVHTVPAGESVSYGALWRAPEDTRVATVQFGYADGYPRGATGRARAVVRGEVRDVLGRICMDQFMLDVQGLDVRVGEWVEVFGWDVLSASDLAAWSDGIEYEVLTGIGARVERTLVESAG
ncbi:alanine racemase [Deinococcus maricopensis]|nr:alanine racemase [Deinococcus maricopensis]